MTATCEHYIGFTGPMLRAAMDGAKTQTRRVVRGVNSCWEQAKKPLSYGPNDFCWIDPSDPCGTYPTMINCPYGKPGDRLRAFSTWAVGPQYDRLKPTELFGPGVQLRSAFWHAGLGPKPEWVGKSRPGRFLTKSMRSMMPLFENVSVRVERVEDISEKDCEAEGIWTACHLDPTIQYLAARIYGKPDRPVGVRDYFAITWSRINGPRGFNWHANPWVWVIEFRKIAAEKPQ